MPKSRTITRDSVFRPTSADAHASLPRQGKREVETVRRQTAVWLADDEVDWLDSQCRAVRKGGWRSVTRSAFIRALIQASMDQSFDLADIANERQLADRLAAHEAGHGS